MRLGALAVLSEARLARQPAQQGKLSEAQQVPLATLWDGLQTGSAVLRRALVSAPQRAELPRVPASVPAHRQDLPARRAVLVWVHQAA
jgi:hypothetical protein